MGWLLRLGAAGAGAEYGEEHRQQEQAVEEAEGDDEEDIDREGDDEETSPITVAAQAYRKMLVCS